jgi:hypothetical protein
VLPRSAASPGWYSTDSRSMGPTLVGYARVSTDDQKVISKTTR